MRRFVASLLPLLGFVPRGAAFTELVPLPPPRIVAASPTVAFGNTPVANLLDGDRRSEFQSAAAGLRTFVEFDFGAPTAIAGFEYQDCWKGGTLQASELTLLDGAGRILARVPIIHPDRRGAIVMAPMGSAVTARRARWQVTRLGAERQPNVGGAEIRFFGPGARVAAATGLRVEALPLPIADGAGTQPSRQELEVTVTNPYLERISARVTVGALAPVDTALASGPQTLTYLLPVSAQEETYPVSVKSGEGEILVRSSVVVPALRHLTIYVLPHSHVDIGYTQLQTEVEEKQVNNLLAGIAAARRTSNYPAGARFVWNLEGLWPADLYLHRLGPAQRDDLLAAIREGQVALDGMYVNELTGLCGGEELMDLFRYGTVLRGRTGAAVDSAMISDVPGYTWGVVTAMAQAGIRYFSAAPNHFDRIGTTMTAWENKPFWWVGPSGRDRVLVWIPPRGYALAAIIRHLSPRWLVGFAEELTRERYPYDVAYVRWSGLGDNAVPDPSVCDFVRDWNAAHPWPHFVIGSVHDAFSDLERRHGSQLPVVRGDFTPYWEDGAGSSALETAMNRASAERLAEAEALWAITEPGEFPARDFAAAMRHVLLYDEHTWGAGVSITDPANSQVAAQWSIKRGYAAAADLESRDLLSRAESRRIRGGEVPGAVDVLNLSSWTRSEVVRVPRQIATGAGSIVKDDHGAAVPSQRLADGELAFAARDLPPLASRRYTISEGEPPAPGAGATATGMVLRNERVRVELDPRTGDIVALTGTGGGGNVADGALNRYLYFNGADARTAVSSSPARVRVVERGPLIASLVAESDAPGCFALARTVTVTAGDDCVAISDRVDKQRVNGGRFSNFRAPQAKESVNFSFPFQVPKGQVRLQIPLAVMRPDLDQIPGACKNWFVVDRWADVSNAGAGVTWVPLDSPLVEVGGLTANLLNSQTDPRAWRTRVGPTQRLDAWVMNNHWGTNYRAYQEGPVTFRFLVRPHGVFDAAAAMRFAQAAAQPLLVLRASGPPPAAAPRLALDSDEVIILELKPTDDGAALLVRLWGAGDRRQQVHLRWASPAPCRVRLSDTGEGAGTEVRDAVAVEPSQVVTLRAEW